MKESAKKYTRTPFSTRLYSFGGLLIVLNSMLFTPAVPLNSAAKAIGTPSVQTANFTPAIQDEEPVPMKLALANKGPAPKRVIYVTVTAYSSTPDQTDSTPFITANGTRVRDGIVAANFLRFGTNVCFPDYFGDKLFEVTDRMNERYPARVDIWMPTREKALDFGVRTLKMEIY